MSDSIKEKINNIIYDEFEIQDLNESDMLEADLGMDDLDMIALEVSIEEEFDIELSDSEFLDNKGITIGDIYNIVERKTSNG